MINYCKSKGPQFGDGLIDYDMVDNDILFCFFNLAMTTMATVKFKDTGEILYVCWYKH